MSRQVKNSIPRKSKMFGDVLVAKPVLEREELINIYFLLLLAFGGMPISTVSIAVIAFFLYSDRECVKRHRVLRIMVYVSSKHNRMDYEKPTLQTS
ncbi:hypothetical protein TNCV_864141 [Trichonephila clavipes]|nr:hypothetical protein TNCV_864141 [Trichonephila clavipes]